MSRLFLPRSVEGGNGAPGDCFKVSEIADHLEVRPLCCGHMWRSAVFLLWLVFVCVPPGLGKSLMHRGARTPGELAPAPNGEAEV